MSKIHSHTKLIPFEFLIMEMLKPSVYDALMIIYAERYVILMAISYTRIDVTKLSVELLLTFHLD